MDLNSIRVIPFNQNTSRHYWLCKPHLTNHLFIIARIRNLSVKERSHASSLVKAGFTMDVQHVQHVQKVFRYNNNITCEKDGKPVGGPKAW